MRILFKLIALFFIFQACREKTACEKAPDIAHIEIEWEFEDLITPLIEAESPQRLWHILEQNPVYARLFLNTADYNTEEEAMQSIYGVFSNPHFRDTLHREVKNTFGDFSQLKAEFTKAFTYYQYYFPHSHIPKIQLAMSGLQQDMYVSDTLIIIGLDYFLGEGATYRPAEIPNYILRRYEPNYVVPITFLMLSQKHNKTDFENQSLVSDMIYYGKSFEFVKRMNPCVEDEVIMGYTSEEMEGSLQNEDVIWANFLENEVLYETNHLMKTKFVGERPKTYEIGDKCPGRIGQWVGWRMIQQYMQKQSHISLKELMESNDAERIFHESRYKPKRKK